MRSSATAVAVVHVSAPAAEPQVPRALLHFPLKAYQPREAPAPGPLAPPPAPQSIKDAIVRWLDEQL